MSTNPDIERIEKFYDDFQGRLVQDFLLGNERVEAALRFIFSRFPDTLRHVLDLGCGLGWTSFEMARAFPSARVLGVDISEGLLQAGERLFPKENLHFKKVDIFQDDFAVDHPFDAVTLIDVYEHIPADRREAFHQRLGRILTDSARIAVTCPTVLHQRWLREQHPDQLQPVDEDVTAADMLRFAGNVGGTLTVFEYQSIWHTNDYFHALIERRPAWEHCRDFIISTKKLMPPAARAALVYRRLDRSLAPLKEWPNLKRFIKRSIFH